VVYGFKYLFKECLQRRMCFRRQFILRLTSYAVTDIEVFMCVSLFFVC
jgi:hypothetical protein